MKSFDKNTATPSKDVRKSSMQTKRKSTETTHISILDKFGNAVSVTTTQRTSTEVKPWFLVLDFLNNEKWMTFQ
jgi:gamma-glutamyltranspeptidase